MTMSGFWLSNFLVCAVALSLCLMTYAVMTKDFMMVVVIIVANLAAALILGVMNNGPGRVTDLTIASLVIYIIILIVAVLVALFGNDAKNPEERRGAQLILSLLLIAIFVVLIMAFRASVNEMNIYLDELEELGIYLRDSR